MKALETKFMLLNNYMIMHNVFILVVSYTLMMAHTPCLSDVQRISTSSMRLSDLEHFYSSPLYKEQSQHKNKVTGMCRKYITENRPWLSFPNA